MISVPLTKAQESGDPLFRPSIMADDEEGAPIFH
jgi:hypothetical protein